MFRRYVSKPTTTTGIREDLVKPVKIDPMGTMYVSKLSRTPFEEDLNGSLIVLRNYQIDRTTEFSHGQNIIDMIEPEGNFIHELTGN